MFEDTEILTDDGRDERRMEITVVVIIVIIFFFSRTCFFLSMLPLAFSKRNRDRKCRGNATTTLCAACVRARHNIPTRTIIKLCAHRRRRRRRRPRRAIILNIYSPRSPLSALRRKTAAPGPIWRHGADARPTTTRSRYSHDETERDARVEHKSRRPHACALATAA